MYDLSSFIVGCDGLSVPNVKTPEDILKAMDGIKYDRSKDDNKYIIKTPTELLRDNAGICYDAVELERKLFHQIHYKFKTYFIYEIVKGKVGGTHTFLLYEEHNKIYLFEYMWIKYKGIYGPFNKYENGIEYVRKKFKLESDDIHVIEYTEFDYKGMNINQFGQYILDNFKEV